ncbi:MAG: hypothetical protein NC453_24640, partial [Muribaculum sp.]|nr:hypothetical protein [Muribaculum sp.]
KDMKKDVELLNAMETLQIYGGIGFPDSPDDFNVYCGNSQCNCYVKDKCIGNMTCPSNGTCTS